MMNFAQLPFTEQDYKEFKPDGSFGMQHDDFWKKFEKRVVDIILEVVKDHNERGEDSTFSHLKMPEKLIDAAESEKTFKKFSKGFYYPFSRPTVKDGDLYEPGMGAKISHKEYATGEDFSKGKVKCKDLVLPSCLEPLRDNFVRSGFMLVDIFFVVFLRAFVDLLPIFKKSEANEHLCSSSR